MRFDVVGIGNALVDVTAFTLLARMVPNAVMARVFGVLESIGALAVGLGSLTAPLAIEALGTEAALVVVGFLVHQLMTEFSSGSRAPLTNSASVGSS